MILPEQNEWQIRDEDDMVLPYYTHVSLEWIQKNIPQDLTVLEIGGGYSTKWWRKHAKLVHTIESDEELAGILGEGCTYVHHLNIGEYLKTVQDYDIVIPDGDGDRYGYVLESFKHCKKYFIVDNWQQEEVCIYPDDVVKHLYENTKEQLVFKQHNHPHWKTAIFIL